MKEKNKSIKVSIITVSLNSEKTIEQTILSVLHQTYRDVEYIIIDGNSSDGTTEIIKRYENRIAYWVSEPDKGLYDAMNKGVKIAKGKIIGIINSDDWYESDAVEKIVEIFSKNKDLDIIHGGIRIYDNEQYSSTYCPPTRELNLCMIPHPACFITKSTYDKFGLYDLSYKIAADYDFVAKVFSNKGKFIFSKEIFANLRLGGISDLNNKAGGDEAGIIRSKYNLEYVLSLKKRIKNTVKHLIGNKKI